MKKDIVINFPKQKRFIISKSNWKPRKLTKRLAEEFAKLAESVKKFTDIKKDFVGANQDCAHPNSKSEFMGIKPEK